MTSGSGPGLPLNGLNGGSTPRAEVGEVDGLAHIRRAMLAANEAGLPWSEIARHYGITKGMAYYIGVKGHTPKRGAILKALHANRAELIVQVVRRDGAGRFKAPLP